jgi:hypothetical protein
VRFKQLCAYSFDILKSPRTVVRDEGDRRTTSQNCSSTNEYGTDRQVWSLHKFKQLRDFSFDILPGL